MNEATLDEPPFPNDFEPVEALKAYLAAHKIAQLILLLIVVGIAYLVANTQAERDAVQAKIDALPIDDEPVDDEDRAAIEAARIDTGFVSLDTYLGRAS